MNDERVKILENKKVNDEYYKLTFSSKQLSRRVLPGQFVNVQIDEAPDPLLRRPFSYYRVRGQRVELLYEILGRGTGLLADKKRGHGLNVLGPLGKPFTRALKGKKRVLVAGGVGVPPLVMLAEAVGKENPPLVMMIGCKTKKEVLPRRELSKIKGDVQYATNDGSHGAKGFVSVLLKKLIKRENPKSLYIQTCGPHAMMEAVMDLAEKHGIEGEASIDERMACGVGTCLGCVVATQDGYKTSCVEGPVFRFSELVRNGKKN
jgi:dihydroorotate dehydrogenase electron transfer subunit